MAFLLAGGCDPAALQSERFPGEQVMYGETRRIRGFDPVKVGDVASIQAIAKIYEGLLQYSYLDRPYRVEPLLAETLPEVFADGLIYTFKIRPGIYFQDDPCFEKSGGKGRELTADDFVYSIKRVADQKNASSGWWAFRGRIAGLDEFRAASASPEPTDYSAEVAGLKALDRNTLHIRLTAPYPQLSWVLTMHYAFAVPREAVEHYGRNFANHPVGTGPFVLDSFRQNYSAEYIRNPKWRQTGRIERDPHNGEPLPHLDRIVNYVIGDPTTAWMLFLNGQLDISGISRDAWNAVINDVGELNDDLKAKGIRLVTSPSLDLYYIGFNMVDPVVGKNEKLRQAMTCAFNTEEWVRFFNGRVTRPDGPIPPGVVGYEKREHPFPFDLDRARRLLAEAGYPGGVDPATGRRLQLTLEVGQADNPEVRQSTELFVQFMDRLGIVVQPSYNNQPAFFDKIERRQAQMFRLSWIADYPDAENFLQVFYGPNASPGSNRANYSDSDFDRLYEQVRVMPDSPERTALYRKMADRVIEDCPWIFIYHPVSYILIHDRVQNYTYHDFSYGMEKYYRVDMRQKRNRETH